MSAATGLGTAIGSTIEHWRVRWQPHLDRRLAIAGSAVLLAFAAFELTVLVSKVLATPGSLGVDFHTVLAAARSWMHGDGFYLARQLHGPYAHQGGDILYPPTILWLLIPFTGLPEIIWWVIPVLGVGYAIVAMRPAPWTWPVMAAILAYEKTLTAFLYGNPVLWIVLFLALGLLWAWPSAFILLKPSLGPFALVGVLHRSWWLALAALVLLSLPFGGLWGDYLRASIDSQLPFWYSLPELPLVLLPVVAAVGRQRRPREPTAALLSSGA